MTTETRTFNLGEYGTATATITTYAADVIYTVTAPHLAGSFTIRPMSPLEYEPGAGVEVVFGRDGAPAADHRNWTLTIEKPVVHRVTLTTSARVYRHQLPTLPTSPLSLWRERTPPGTGKEGASAAVNVRASAAIGAIVADYLTRPDLAELHQAHATHQASARIHGAASAVRTTEQAINRQLAELRQKREQLAMLRRIAGGETVTLHTSTRRELARIPADT